MKRCPDCGREYDNTMMFCLDDGAELLYGPARSDRSASAGGQFGDDEPATAILHSTAAQGEAPTRAQIDTTDRTSVSHPGAETTKKAGGFDKRLLLAPIVLAAIVLGGFGAYRYLAPSNTGQIDSIAVLPFENRSGSADTDYLSDGLADSLIYRLSQLPNLKVSPTSSVMRYKGMASDAAKVANELGVDAVMTGRLSQIGDNLNISVQLIDVKAGKVLWAEQYDRKMADLLATQREIATTITQKLQLKLTGDERGIAKKYTESSEAYQLYLKGRYHFARRNRDDVNKAIESFEQAIKLDPNFALAYARIAEAYNQMPNYPYASPMEAFPKAKAAAERAIALDPTLSEAHTAMGNTLTSLDRNWPEAEREFKRALELDPNSATAHYRYASEYLISVGRTKEALAEVERALELEPLDPNMVANLGRHYLYDGQRDRALTQARRAYEADPTFVIARLLYGMTLNAVSQYAEAIALSENALKDDPNNQQMLMVAGYAYGRSGRRADAESVIEKFREISKTQYVIPSFVAVVFGAMGEKDRAFAELDKSIEQRDSWFRWAKVEPLFDPLRDDPRYKNLLKRMGLPE
ncbi:MAG: tetratricopeptide repeat protein [Blastocatellia bacterium]|nr:tetratricopeptide repeat protein [Blastocatellia bacterium]